MNFLSILFEILKINSLKKLKKQDRAIWTLTLKFTVLDFLLLKRVLDLNTHDLIQAVIPQKFNNSIHN